jgi:Putative Zn-dependent protease, contains TPR repeats
MGPCLRISSMRKAPAVAVSLLFPLLAFAQRRSPDRSLADRASELNTDQQIALYQKQSAAQPSNAHFQNLLASAYVQKVRESTDFTYLDRASKILDSVLGADAGNYEAMRLRSEIEMERHHFAQVREYSEELTKIAPEDPWNWGTLGDSLMELGECDQAGKAYEKMLALNPNQASYNRLAYHRFVTGKANEAIRLMTLATGAGSWAPENTAWCLVELGNMYFKTGRLDAAERAYSNALALFDGYHTAHAGLGRVKAAQGNIAVAIVQYKRAQASVPLPDYAAALYTLYQQSGKPMRRRSRTSLLTWCTGWGKPPARRPIAIWLIYADRGEHLDRALDLVREELKVRQDVYTYDALAWVLYKNKQYAEAEPAMERAIKMDSPEPGFYYHAGMIALALGRKLEAARLLQRSLDLNPKFDPVQALIAKQKLASLTGDNVR